MKIKKSKLIEILKSNNLNESLVKKLLGIFLKNKNQDKLERLTTDPEFEKILKKHNLKPVDWNASKQDSFFNS